MLGCYIWYSEKETGWSPSPPRPLLAVPNVTAHPSTAPLGPGWGLNPPRPLVAVPNVTAHPSTASVPITVLLCNEWSVAVQF